MYASSRYNSPFQNSFKALAFGSVLIDPDRRHLAEQGKFYYGQALKAINKALKDPEYAYSDETLMSILMCSLCEVIHFHAMDDFYNSRLTHVSRRFLLTRSL